MAREAAEPNCPSFLLIFPLPSAARTPGHSPRQRRELVVADGVHRRALRCLLTCGMHFARLSSPVVVALICLDLVDVVQVCVCLCVCVRGVASVHAACLRVDVIKAAAPHFPCGFILSAEGRRFLMVFHLSTVGLVPAGSPGDLLASLPASILCVVSPHLRSRRHSLLLPGVSLLPTETHMHTHRTRDGVCLCIIHKNANTREARDSYPMRVSRIATCPLLNI